MSITYVIRVAKNPSQGIFYIQSIEAFSPAMLRVAPPLAHNVPTT